LSSIGVEKFEEPDFDFVLILLILSKKSAILYTYLLQVSQTHLNHNLAYGHHLLETTNDSFHNLHLLSLNSPSNELLSENKLEGTLPNPTNLAVLNQIQVLLLSTLQQVYDFLRRRQSQFTKVKKSF